MPRAQPCPGDRGSAGPRGSSQAVCPIGLVLGARWPPFLLNSVVASPKINTLPVVSRVRPLTLRLLLSLTFVWSTPVTVCCPASSSCMGTADSRRARTRGIATGLPASGALGDQHQAPSAAAEETRARLAWERDREGPGREDARGSVHCRVPTGAGIRMRKTCTS